MRMGKNVHIPDVVMKELRKGGPSPFVLWMITSDISQEGFDYMASLVTEEAEDQWGERLKAEEKAILRFWLEEATRDLCTQAKQRIYAELVAHYDDAVKHAVASGLTHGEAQLQVVAHLGSPREANKAFRRAYLTQSEEYELRVPPAPLSFTTILKSVAFPLYILSSLALPFLFHAETRGFLTSTALPALAFVLVHQYVKRSHVPALVRRNRYRQAVLWKTALFLVDSLVFWSVLVSWSVFFERQYGNFLVLYPITVGLVCLVGALGSTFRSATLLRKLRKY